MILSRKPISMAEVVEELKQKKSEEKEFIDFIKKFSKLGTDEAKKLEQELKSLDLIKMRDEEIVKITDILPETEADLNKIFSRTNLDSEESKKVLDVVHKYL